MQEKTCHCDWLPDRNQENIHLLPWKIARPLEGVVFFCTTRLGGISQGAYASFNLGDHVQDQPEHVASNRARLMASLAPYGKALWLVNQVHGATSVQAGWQGSPPSADAVVTDFPGRVVGVMTADCAPILFADPQARVVGAAHAGWRGALGGVLESCVTSMERLGARREKLIALIGPCIQADSYQVDATFHRHFLQSAENKLGMECQKFFSNQRESGKVQFDLPGYVKARLIKAGLDSQNILDLGHCTYAMDTLYFSHRRAVHHHQAPCGRQMAGIHLL